MAGINRRQAALTHSLFLLSMAVRLEKPSSQRYVVENLRCRWCLSLLGTVVLLDRFSSHTKHKRVGAAGSMIKENPNDR